MIFLLLFLDCLSVGLMACDSWESVFGHAMADVAEAVLGMNCIRTAVKAALLGGCRSGTA